MCGPPGRHLNSERIPKLRTGEGERTGRSCRVSDLSPSSQDVCSSRGSEPCDPVPVQSPALVTTRGGGHGQPRTVSHSLFLLTSIPSSHLDPASTHAALQGSSAPTPEHPSVIDPLMEQDEGPGTPQAKQSTPSSRSANPCREPPICAPWPRGVGGWAAMAVAPTHPAAVTWAAGHIAGVRIWGGKHAIPFFLSPSCPFSLSCFFSLSLFFSH